MADCPLPHRYVARLDDLIQLGADRAKFGIG
jgi:hypothetical protein